MSKMTSFSLQHKTVHVYPAPTACPIIYFHAFEEISEQLLQQLRAAHCPQATFVIISDLDWNRDMVPWDIPAKMTPSMAAPMLTCGC